MATPSTEAKPKYNRPEVWAGLECTINRINDTVRDQLQLTGHYERPMDIRRLAALAIKAVRYPVLWEHHEHHRHQKIDWAWTDRQLGEIRNNGITVIAGLLHHGSGPFFTHLLDPDFPGLLAAYAHQVATRFPWIDHYTPVNEPLTTARFSGLYGHWYPHHHDDASFARMLIHQLMGTVLSMQAIRKINPRAKLVQTEDLAKTHSTPLLKYQADFENERRWLTSDLLCGRVNTSHPLWSYLLSAGITRQELQFFTDNPCPPDIMGCNYYVTSERYLDENTEQYPGITPGGNASHRYVDIEAVRATRSTGLAGLLEEAWTRYHITLAVTEAHMGCTREEQMRWLMDTWNSACLAIQKGVEIQAVTAWAAFGAFDWNSLLTRSEGHYEPGLFDIRNNTIKPTALAMIVHALATQNTYSHPLLNNPGWWRRSHLRAHAPAKVPLLIITNLGSCGNAFAKCCTRRNITHTCVTNTDPDIDEKDLIRHIRIHKPWAVINATGYKHPRAAQNQNGITLDMTMDLLIDEASGTWHIASEGEIIGKRTALPLSPAYLSNHYSR